jgi:hypothetical protein
MAAAAAAAAPPSATVVSKKNPGFDASHCSAWAAGKFKWQVELLMADAYVQQIAEAKLDAATAIKPFWSPKVTQNKTPQRMGCT